MNPKRPEVIPTLGGGGGGDKARPSWSGAVRERWRRCDPSSGTPSRPVQLIAAVRPSRHPCRVFRPPSALQGAVSHPNMLSCSNVGLSGLLQEALTTRKGDAGERE